MKSFRSLGALLACTFGKWHRIRPGVIRGFWEEDGTPYEITAPEQLIPLLLKLHRLAIAEYSAPTVPDTRPSMEEMSDRLGHILAVLNGSSFASTEEYIDVRDTIIQLNRELKSLMSLTSDDVLAFANELEAASWASLKAMDTGGIDYDLLTDEQKQCIAIRRAAELEAWFPIIKRRLALLPVQRTVTVEELTKAMDAVYKLPGTAFWDHRRLCSEILSRINRKEGV